MTTTLTIAQYLEATARLLIDIDTNALIEKQREEQDLWEGRVKNCGVALQKFQQEWNNQDVIPLVRTDNGKTFEQRVKYLYKTTKEFHHHLDFYAK